MSRWCKETTTLASAFYLLAEKRALPKHNPNLKNPSLRCILFSWSWQFKPS